MGHSILPLYSAPEYGLTYSLKDKLQLDNKGNSYESISILIDTSQRWFSSYWHNQYKLFKKNGKKSQYIQTNIENTKYYSNSSFKVSNVIGKKLK